jgi:ATP-dependent helicase HrpA
VLVEEVGGAPVWAYPGIEAEGAGVNVRLYKRAEEAVVASAAGIRKLVEMGIASDLAGIGKDLGAAARKLHAPIREGRVQGNPLEQLAKLGGGLSAGCTSEAFQTAALRRLVESAFEWTPTHPLSSGRFEVFLEQGRRALPGLAVQLLEWTRQVVKWRETLQNLPKRYRGMEADVERLAPANLPEHTSFGRLQHLPRYLKAVQIRAERAALKPAKDAEKAAQLAPYDGWQRRVAADKRETFRWLLEEFRVSLFAQELGTAESVSAARLNAFLEG